jgi:CheY-like chemotaxis protein
VLARADEHRLAQVVHHLVEYAISETRNGYVEIAVAGGTDPQQGTIRIHDTAEGLPEAARRALSEDPQELDPFIVGEGGFAEPPPVSLPLLLAARLAKLMNLRIGVQSSVADGVSFEIALPLVTEEAAAVAWQTPAPAGDGGRDRLSHIRPSGRVLLIEDDLYERRRVGGIIESLGYRVTLAASGDEGLALLQDGHFDAVVLDLVMPGMSGLDVLRAARTEQRLGDVPFIVLSALYMTKGERAVLGPRVTDVVRKGDTTSEELAIALRRAIAHATEESRPTPDDGASHAPGPK